MTTDNTLKRTSVVLDLTDDDIRDISTLLCRSGESWTNALTRIIKSEIKSKKLQKDLGGR